MDSSREAQDNQLPLISILMALYNPNLEWLSQQLESLNSQDYPNLELNIQDDCSTESFRKVEQCIKEHTTSIPYTLERNVENLGSTKTFELLSSKAAGEYIAFCDQDDIWRSDKLSCLQKELQDSSVALVCSDVVVIDGSGKQIAQSMTEVRKRHSFYSGPDAFNKILFRNFVIGCTSLIPKSLVLAALPFPTTMVHDHWLALYASLQGSIKVASDKLVYYRIHENNQTNVLTSISTKSEYIERSVLLYYNRLKEIGERIPSTELVEKSKIWVEARKKNITGERGAVRTLWKLRKLNKPTSLFEIFMMRMPEKAFQAAISLIKRWL